MAWCATCVRRGPDRLADAGRVGVDRQQRGALGDLHPRRLRSRGCPRRIGQRVASHRGGLMIGSRSNMRHQRSRHIKECLGEPARTSSRGLVELVGVHSATCPTGPPRRRGRALRRAERRLGTWRTGVCRARVRMPGSSTDLANCAGGQCYNRRYPVEQRGPMRAGVVLCTQVAPCDFDLLCP